jgi:hypothetical protein
MIATWRSRFVQQRYRFVLRRGPVTNGVLLVLLRSLRVSNGIQYLTAQSCEKCFKGACMIQGHEAWVISEKDTRKSSGPMNSHVDVNKRQLIISLRDSVNRNKYLVLCYILFTTTFCRKCKSSGENIVYEENYRNTSALFSKAKWYFKHSAVIQ